MGLRMQELLIILLIVLVFFGAKRLPALARSLGSSIRDFKKGIQGEGEQALAQPEPILPSPTEPPSKA